MQLTYIFNYNCGCLAGVSSIRHLHVCNLYYTIQCSPSTTPELLSCTVYLIIFVVVFVCISSTCLYVVVLQQH